MGVQKIIPKMSAQALLEIIVESEPEDVWFFGTHFNMNLSYSQELFIQLLQKQSRLFFLITNPFDKTSIDFQAKGFGIKNKNLYKNCRDGIFNFLQLMKQWQEINDTNKNSEYHTKIIVKISSNLPRTRAYIVDIKNPNATSDIIPYMNNITARESPIFASNNSLESLSLLQFKGIEEEWRKDQTRYLQDYIKESNGFKEILHESAYNDFLDKYPKPNI